MNGDLMHKTVSFKGYSTHGNIGFDKRNGCKNSCTRAVKKL